jgi:hypothetical protein
VHRAVIRLCAKRAASSPVKKETRIIKRRRIARRIVIVAIAATLIIFMRESRLLIQPEHLLAEGIPSLTQQVIISASQQTSPSSTLAVIPTPAPQSDTTLQIGILIVPEWFLDILFPLIGTLLGGFIAYWSARAVENRKWEREQIEKFLQQKRDAIATTLKTIDEMLEFIDSIDSHFQVLQGNDSLLDKMPHVASLAKINAPSEVPVHLRGVFLPDKFYEKVQQEWRDVGVIKSNSDLYFSDQNSQSDDAFEGYIQSMQPVIEKLTTESRSKLEEYKRDLENYYLDTWKRPRIALPNEFEQED